MRNLDRRTFLKYVGGGAAALGLGAGLSGKYWYRTESAWAADAEVQKAGDTWDWSAWEFYYPGKYDEADAKVLKEFKAELDLINNRGDINTKDLINGKLSNVPGVGGGGPGAGKVTQDSMIKMAKQCFLGDDPLFTDKEYAKKTKYGNLIAVPLWCSLEIMPAMPKSKGIGDYMVVSDLCHTMNYFKPFYEGDTLTVVTDGQYFEDTTPTEGSYYRTFVMKGWGRVFNQKGELVAEGASMTNESYRRHKDPAKRNKSGAHGWESPNWWSRKVHMYTDQDYNTMKGFWKNEKSRGATPLYWDDVKIGDQPTPLLTGPIVAAGGGELMTDLSQSIIDTKKNITDPKIFAKMEKNKQGIYVLPESMQEKSSGPMAGGPPGSGMPGGDMGGGAPGGAGGGMPGGDMGGDRSGAPGEGGGAPGEQRGGGIERVERGVNDFETETNQGIKSTDGRQLFWNVMAHRWIAGLLYNWMGDQGWLQRIGRDMMDLPPGADKAVNYQASPTLIPSIPQKSYPKLFDKFPYLEKVPSMKGKRANWHGLEGDTVVSRAYVCDKYSKDGEYFVDLIWWMENFDNYLILEGFATVKLPKKA
jgi:acyl dehydratase